MPRSHAAPPTIDATERNLRRPAWARISARRCPASSREDGRASTFRRLARATTRRSVSSPMPAGSSTSSSRRQQAAKMLGQQVSRRPNATGFPRASRPAITILAFRPEQRHRRPRARPPLRQVSQADRAGSGKSAAKNLSLRKVSGKSSSTRLDYVEGLAAHENFHLRAARHQPCRASRRYRDDDRALSAIDALEVSHRRPRARRNGPALSATIRSSRSITTTPPDRFSVCSTATGYLPLIEKNYLATSASITPGSAAGSNIKGILHDEAAAAPPAARQRASSRRMPGDC